MLQTETKIKVPSDIAKITLGLLTLGTSINNIQIPITKRVDFHTGTV